MLEFYNGKVNKIYKDLMNGSEISRFELDERNKKCYLGDNNGKIRSYNIINGNILKNFKSHNSGIIKIIHCSKNKMLITGSSDLYIRFHSEIDNKDDIYKEICALNNSDIILSEKLILKHFIYNENDNMLIMALSKGIISFYDFNYNKFINDIFVKN